MKLRDHLRARVIYEYSDTDTPYENLDDFEKQSIDLLVKIIETESALLIKKAENRASYFAYMYCLEELGGNSIEIARRNIRLEQSKLKEKI